MRRNRFAWLQLLDQDLADRSVTLTLNPGPTVGFVEHQDVVPGQKLRVDTGIRSWRTTQIDD